jgi:hypothetical protein
MDRRYNIGLNEDKKICHGLGCFNYATHSIQEDGYDGTLLICDNCIIKFPKRIIHESITEAPKL